MAIFNDQDNYYEDLVSSQRTGFMISGARITRGAGSGYSALIAGLIFMSKRVSGEILVHGFASRNLSLDLLEPVFLEPDIRLHALYCTGDLVVDADF
jgi:hypothetical protein